VWPRKPRKDLTGQKFGQLLVLEYAHSKLQNEGKTKATRIYYRCRCDCGAELIVLGGNLSKGNSTSCGTCNRRTSCKELTGSFFGQIQHSAQVRNLAFEVTQQHLWDLFVTQGRRCALTGWELMMPRHRVKGTASLDRIDSSKPYCEGNLQWVHKDVNLAKQSMTNEQFITMCSSVTAHEKGVGGGL
jgi:hypothetical protein